MIGVTRTKDIVMRSRRIPGHQAYEWGIATECVADTDLEAATDRLFEELCGFPPLAQRTAKKLLNDIEDANLSLAKIGLCFIGDSPLIAPPARCLIPPA
jgi:2-oxoglutaroyl-CoA hydrolase